MIDETADGILLQRFRILAGHTDVSHFVSTRCGGVSDPPYDSLNVGYNVGDHAEHVSENRRRLASAIGVDLSQFTLAEQVHGARVVSVPEQVAGTAPATKNSLPIRTTDAMVTNTPGIMLMVLVADCVPVLLYDPLKRVVGIAHAGRRGTILNIVGETIAMMRTEFGSEPVDILATLGPSIGPDKYEVGRDVSDQVKRSFQQWDAVLRIDSDGRYFLDLWEFNVRQLLAAGLRREQIEVSEICTFRASSRYFSHRLQHPCGRFAAGIMIRR